MSDYLGFRAMLLEAYLSALAQALPPKPRVAQHWESTRELTFLALVPDQFAFHLSFGFGVLKGSPPPSLGPPTAGVFRLTSAIFPAVKDERLALTLTELVPATVEGPSRAFLLRVCAQLATAEVAATLERRRTLIPLATSKDFLVVVPRRPDLLYEPTLTPRLPARAAARIREALTVLAPALRERLEAVFSAEEPLLLDVVRHASWAGDS